jgi:deazaflavin-dependent oxidoreductase (nitroreductase family)
MKHWTAADWAVMNDPVVAEFRANGGKVKGRGPLLLLTTTGATTGKPRLTPLNWSPDGDRYVVIGSKGGSQTHPAWFRNLVADPRVTLEVGEETFPALARIAQEPERTRLYDAQVRLMGFFEKYRQAVTDREIPVVVFERVRDEAP